jgi:hypothetical protein
VDFQRPDGTVKAEHIVDDLPLLRRALESRSWWRRGECSASDLVFVLRDTEGCRAFAERSLYVWYPESRLVWLRSSTQGAALSALAGVAAVAHLSEPLGVDLCDILFEETISPRAFFARSDELGGLGLAFRSTNPLYSYFRCDAEGGVTETIEKTVISDIASAGTYWFRSPSVYLAALARNIEHPAEVCFNGLFFVCPVFNGVITNGLRVEVEFVSSVYDIKLLA